MPSKDVSQDTPPLVSPTPATGMLPDFPQPETRFTHADWKRKALENMNKLGQNPELASALRRRGF